MHHRLVELLDQPAAPPNPPPAVATPPPPAPRSPWTRSPPVYPIRIGNRKKIIGPTSSARSSFGVHPVGMKNAVIRPHAMNAPMLGITIPARNPPKRWILARIPPPAATGGGGTDINIAPPPPGSAHPVGGLVW